jgi:hypothetical protein
VSECVCVCVCVCVCAVCTRARMQVYVHVDMCMLWAITHTGEAAGKGRLNEKALLCQREVACSVAK